MSMARSSATKPATASASSRIESMCAVIASSPDSHRTTAQGKG